MAALSLTAHAQTLPLPLQTPEIVSINRMPMKATSFAYENAELAKAKDPTKSKYFLSLNGSWKFHWVQDPRKRPADFYKTNYDDQQWDDFKVPANWELNGYGLPIYVNHPYEFTGKSKMGAALNPPFDIPVDNNPVGSYRKRFQLPESWNGRQVFIHLGAVKSAFFIWINGQQVGYSEDSKLAAEFDITPYVHKGENVVALQVYRWSDGSYLECQDMWRISGIERDVYLYSTPKLDVRDFTIKTDLADGYTTGIFSFNAVIKNYKIDKRTLHSKPDTFSIHLALKDAGDNTVFQTAFTNLSSLGNYEQVATTTGSVANVKAWSAETPYLYTMYISLLDKDGTVIEAIPARIGFRSIRIAGDNFLVNGKRVFFKGVNRHEHDPKQGHTLTKEDMVKDMEMMKKLNINAVRNSHYPPDPYWMQLCDEYGLYVVDEANIESHGRGYDLQYTLGNDKKWKEAHMQRVMRMYERDKNHPSVVTWSLGNEAGNGTNFYAAYDWLKKQDDRPVQYERAEWDYNTDMIVPQYPDPKWLVQFSNSDSKRLLIMSEYAHIMGNSLGNFQEYWDAIETHPKLQGGFVWEWIDQTIDTVKNGRRIMAYGGDFPLGGPVPVNFSDNNFCVKGVVTAYRKLTPMSIELKKVYQHIKTSLSNDSLTIRNGYFFKDLANVQMNWEVTENGRVIRSGTIADLAIQPQQQVSLALPANGLNRSAGKEYFFNVRFALKTSEPFLEKGYVIAYDQFPLQLTSVRPDRASKAGRLILKKDTSEYIITGKGFHVRFDTHQGVMTDYTIGREQLLYQGPKPSFWRAPTDNDIGAGFNKSLRMWRNVYDSSAVLRAAAEQTGEGQVSVSFTKNLSDDDAQVTQTFTVYADGTVRVENNFKALKGTYPLLLRVGNDLQVSKTLDQVSWYGRGPCENYWDRKTASLVGIYDQRLQDQYFPYVRPQESGNKSDVRWYALTNKKGRGLTIIYADSLLNCSAIPYSLDDLDPAPEKHQFHSGELNVRDTIFMHVDLQQTGLQGIDSWGSWPLPQYRIPYADHSYSYWIVPEK